MTVPRVEDGASATVHDTFGRDLARRVRRDGWYALVQTSVGLGYVAIAIWKPWLWNKFIYGVFAAFFLGIGRAAAGRWWTGWWMRRDRASNFAAGRAEPWHDVDAPADGTPGRAVVPRAAEWMRRVYERHGYGATRRAFEYAVFEIDGKKYPWEGAAGSAERRRRDAEAQRANVLIAKACHAEALAAWAELHT